MASKRVQRGATWRRYDARAGQNLAWISLVVLGLGIAAATLRENQAGGRLILCYAISATGLLLFVLGIGQRCTNLVDAQGMFVARRVTFFSLRTSSKEMDISKVTEVWLERPLSRQGRNYFVQLELRYPAPNSAFGPDFKGRWILSYYGNADEARRDAEDLSQLLGKPLIAGEGV